MIRPHTDLVALDDLGDAGAHEAAGHGQWSVWAALAASSGAAICASSGYDWGADAEVLLNTAVLGAPGAVLPSRLPDGRPVPSDLVGRRHALARWHRRTTRWTPWWLDTSKGSLEREPRPCCWGRRERIGGSDRLTALAVRDCGGAATERADRAALWDLSWQGSWALVAQDDEDIVASRELACIPFAGGSLQLPRDRRPTRIDAVFVDGSEPVAPWPWNGSQVHLSVPASWSTRGLLGLLVHTDS